MTFEPGYPHALANHYFKQFSLHVAPLHTGELRQLVYHYLLNYVVSIPRAKNPSKAMAAYKLLYIGLKGQSPYEMHLIKIDLDIVLTSEEIANLTMFTDMLEKDLEAANSGVRELLKMVDYGVLENLAKTALTLEDTRPIEEFLQVGNSPLKRQFSLYSPNLQDAESNPSENRWLSKCNSRQPIHPQGLC